MGTESPGFHPWRVFLATNFDQPAEKPFSLGRRGGGAEAGAHALAGIRRQGELADQQQAAAGIGQRAVHPPPASANTR